MSHVRKQVRDWLKANLAGSAQAGSRVYVRRALPIAKDSAAVLLIDIDGEGLAEISMDGLMERQVRFTIRGAAKGSAETTENLLDALGVFVEETIDANKTLGGLAKDCTPESSNFSFSADGEKTLGTLSMNYVATVHSLRGDPETAI